jgi:hypothetical protein
MRPRQTAQMADNSSPRPSALRGEEKRATTDRGRLLDEAAPCHHVEQDCVV